MDLLPSDKSVESAKAAAAKDGEGTFVSLGEVLEGRSDKTEKAGGKGGGEMIGGGTDVGGGTDGLLMKDHVVIAWYGESGEKKEGMVSEMVQKKACLESVFAESVYGERIDQTQTMSCDFSDDPKAQQFGFQIENNKMGATKMMGKDGDGGKSADAFGISGDNDMVLEDEISDCKVLEVKGLGTGNLNDDFLGLKKSADFRSDAADLLEAIDRISDNTAVEETIEFVNIGSESQKSVNDSHDDDDASMGGEEYLYSDVADVVEASRSSDDTAMDVNSSAELNSGNRPEDQNTSNRDNTTPVLISQPPNVGSHIQSSQSDWETVSEYPLAQEDSEEASIRSFDANIETFSFGSDDAIIEDIQTSSPSSQSEEARKFDMELLRSSIAKGEEALEKIKEKDIVLVVGSTGTGKSTFIQAIAGKSFQQTGYEFDADDPLSDFEIGHEKSSKTKCMSVYCRRNDEKRKTVLYVDTPGFFDTDGAEVDIATSVCLTEVAKYSRSIRFICMISYVSLLEDRGGAFRGILKFIRKFVEDFEESKRSFMFLFTHINRIKHVSESIKEARKELLNEVSKVARGTSSNDEEIMAVLNFIRGSLKKGYPFVDLIHPMKTDFGEITSFVENQLSRLEAPIIAGNCGLTSTAQIKLSAEVQRLLHETKYLLQAEKVDLDRIVEIKSHYRYFSKYICFGDVLKTLQDYDVLMNDYFRRLHATIDEEILVGTDDTDRLQDLMRLSQSVTTLSLLDDQFSMHSIANRIEAAVCAFHEKVMKDLQRSFRGIHTKLRKLKTWRQLPNVALGSLFDDVALSLTEKIQMVVDSVKRFDFTKMDQVEDELVELFSKLDLLAQLTIRKGHVVAPAEIDLVVVTRAIENVLQHISFSLKKWNNDCKMAFVAVNFDDEAGVDAIAMKAKTLEAVLKVTQDIDKWKEIRDEAKEVLLKIQNSVIGEFSAACLEMEAKQSELNASLSTQVLALKSSLSAFDEMEDKEWKVMAESFSSLKDSLRRSAHEKSVELTVMARSANEHGLDSGTRHASRLLSLRGLTWVDQLLSPEDQFVKNCTKATVQQYKERASTLNAKTAEILQPCRKECRRRSSSLGELKNMIHEIDEFAELGGLLESEDLIGLRPSVKSLLQEYITSRRENWSETTNQWKMMVQDWKPDDLQRLHESLGDSLDEITVLLGLCGDCGIDDGTVALASDAQTLIRKNLEIFYNELQDPFRSASNFEGMSKCYKFITVIGSHHQTSSLLPKSNELRDRARKIIVSQYEKITKKISETAEFDDIDSLIADLEAAAMLDDVMGLDVRSRLAALKHIRTVKEEEVEKVVEEMIRAKNFRGMKDFLVPRSRSKDLVQKKKFNDCLEAISRSLKADVATLNDKLESTITKQSAVRVNQILDNLFDADSEIGVQLKMKFDAHVSFVRSKQKISQNLTNLIEGTKKAAKNFDIIAMKKSCDLILIYTDILSEHLSRSKKNQCRTCLDRFQNLSTQESLIGRVDKFIASSFKDELDLTAILLNLKKAQNSSDENLAELAVLYVDCTAYLAEKITEVINSYKKLVSEKECYDDSIDVFQCLMRRLDVGLAFHLPHELCECCKDILLTWEEVRRGWDADLAFTVYTAAEKLESFSARLDSNKPSENPGMIGLVWGWVSDRIPGHENSSRTYQRTVSQLEGKAHEWYTSGQRALVSRDLSKLQECIHVLTLMDDKVGKHISAARNNIENLKLETKCHFEEFCEEICFYLESGKTVDFERSFADYRGFVVLVPFLAESERTRDKIKQFHRSLYAVMESEVESVLRILKTHEFFSIKDKLKSIRSFGGFIADNFSLLYQECSVASHLEVDDWMQKLMSGIIQKYFSCGRDIGGLKYLATLGCVPSCNFQCVKKAYRAKSKIFHPDSSKDPRYKDGEKFRQLKNAYDELKIRFDRRQQLESKPFDSELQAIGSNLLDSVRHAIENQKYDSVAYLRFKFHEMAALEDLVEPSIDTTLIQTDIIRLVANHVDSIRIKADSNWSERRYSDLNHNITDLKLMEQHLSSYADIFDKSWTEELHDKIVQDISDLAKIARPYLKDRKTAKEHFEDFRRWFMRIGSILVELPAFKDSTKYEMSRVLELFLALEWGYSYLFEIGLSLRKSEKMENDDERRIAHMILSEFQQFKEVLTMVWNEETIQKPVEDTVKEIEVEMLGKSTPVAFLSAEKLSLLAKTFSEFEYEYKSVLGTYLDPASDISQLVRDIKLVADDLKPVSKSSFGTNVRDKIPRLLAGVFGLFTVLKSGEGYHRLENATDAGIDVEKLLLKPHNIQVLTLLCLFGCEDSSEKQLQSQLMQIRTGEGKSMILGAASAVLALLGFEVRCVCYSDYLSKRDEEQFRELFERFGLTEVVKYSKITSFSEDMAAAKGDIRDLTLSLMRGDQRSSCGLVASSGALGIKREQVLLVDEVDVFFSGSFYGQTYNKIAKLKEPEITAIMIEIWSKSVEGTRKVRISHIQHMPEYHSLLEKYPCFEFCIQNEILRMLDEVRRLDETPYHLDCSNGRIGHEVMDTISYSVNFGYRTIFAYLKEADKLPNRTATLDRELGMLISCGQFSFANISPDAILGVSGTLQVMGDYERSVLYDYGVQRFMLVPSVYGRSNFLFDKGGDGIAIEKSRSDYYHKIITILANTTKEKRAAIVFFATVDRLNDFIDSPFYRKIGRNKSLLREDMSIEEKEFVISKAATAGQVTICSAVFGRGTDFFCKDETVEANGGVHVIQAFFSSDESEEVQIQGRTARQGKTGTFSMVLLEKDLDDNFGISCGSAESWSRGERYEKLREARRVCHASKCGTLESNLTEATKKDLVTGAYFDALCRRQYHAAKTRFKDLYLNMKKRHAPQNISLDLAFVIDNTGSMVSYGSAIEAIMSNMLSGTGCVAARLRGAFPETTFKIRYALMGYRDIDDKNDQFMEHTWGSNGSHFTDAVDQVTYASKNLVGKASGGGDVAEDHLGAIQRCIGWNSASDWDASAIKVLLLLTDAPAHQFVPQHSSLSDRYAAQHPCNLVLDSVVDQMIRKDVGIFIGSFDPVATSNFEDNIRTAFADNKDNTGELEMVSIPLADPNLTLDPSRCQTSESSLVDRHIIFVLDESSSMRYAWAGVVSAYNNYVTRRRQQQFERDLVSVVQFDKTARVTVTMTSIVNAPTSLQFGGRGTRFAPAASSARGVALQTPSSHQPLVVFMSDGEANDAQTAADYFRQLNQEVTGRYGSELELHVIAFRSGASTSQLQMIANSSSKGRLHSASSTYDLSKVFVQIAGGGDKIASVLTKEIGTRVLDAVSDRIVAEYSG